MPMYCLMDSAEETPASSHCLQDKVREWVTGEESKLHLYLPPPLPLQMLTWAAVVYAFHKLTYPELSAFFFS